jgi:hypothetical protein
MSRHGRLDGLLKLRHLQAKIEAQWRRLPALVLGLCTNRSRLDFPIKVIKVNQFSSSLYMMNV